MGWFLADAVPGGRSLVRVGSLTAAVIAVGALAAREPSPPQVRPPSVTSCGRSNVDQLAIPRAVYLDLQARGDALVRRAHEVAALTIAEHPELHLYDAASRGPTGRWLSIELEPFQLLGARLDCAAVVVASIGPHETRYRRGARVTLDERADARVHAAARDACVTAAVEAATEAAVASVPLP